MRHTPSATREADASPAGSASGWIVCSGRRWRAKGMGEIWSRWRMKQGTSRPRGATEGPPGMDFVPPRGLLHRWHGVEGGGRLGTPGDIPCGPRGSVLDDGFSFGSRKSNPASVLRRSVRGRRRMAGHVRSPCGGTRPRSPRTRIADDAFARAPPYRPRGRRRPGRVARAGAGPVAPRDRRRRAARDRADSRPGRARRGRRAGQRVLRDPGRRHRHQLPRHPGRPRAAGGDVRGRGVRQRLLRHLRSAPRRGRAQGPGVGRPEPAPGQRHGRRRGGGGLRHGQPAGADEHLQRRPGERPPDGGGGVDDPDLGAHLVRLLRRARDGHARRGDRRGHDGAGGRAEPELRRPRAVRPAPVADGRPAAALCPRAAAPRVRRPGGRGRGAARRAPVRARPGRGDGRGRAPRTRGTAGTSR